MKLFVNFTQSCKSTLLEIFYCARARVCVCVWAYAPFLLFSIIKIHNTNFISIRNNITRRTSRTSIRNRNYPTKGELFAEKWIAAEFCNWMQSSYVRGAAGRGSTIPDFDCSFVPDSFGSRHSGVVRGSVGSSRSLNIRICVLTGGTSSVTWNPFHGAVRTHGSSADLVSCWKRGLHKWSHGFLLLENAPTKATSTAWLSYRRRKCDNIYTRTNTRYKGSKA
jgi:hypothetical protein